MRLCHARGRSIRTTDFQWKRKEGNKMMPCRTVSIVGHLNQCLGEEDDNDGSEVHWWGEKERSWKLRVIELLWGSFLCRTCNLLPHGLVLSAGDAVTNGKTGRSTREGNDRSRHSSDDSIIGCWLKLKLHGVAENEGTGMPVCVMRKNIRCMYEAKKESEKEAESDDERGRENGEDAEWGHERGEKLGNRHAICWFSLP